MAAILKSFAASSANKGQPSAYYGFNKTNNPVFQALDQEIQLYVGHMKKRCGAGYKRPPEEPCSRASDSLFELWNKYEPRLPVMYFKERLLEIGDFLVSIQEYKLALWQCYERYLKHFGDINVDEIHDVDTFKKVYFPEGFETDDAGLTFRSLMGKSICMYQTVLLTDPKLQNTDSVNQCMQILSFLRLVTQVILPKENLCWLVYNGTIHIYSVSRHLMSLGFSSKVLEYLLWAAMCMESSVPLLSVKYLTWRTTLYAAVCQCYYDCKAGQNAEAFARRALSKINELSQLEDMSNSCKSAAVEADFRQATVKMAVLVYKRVVLETRKPRKGLLRPKTRANLKDAHGLPWPRTPSEKLLADMLEGSAAQMLAILESLSDSNRRTLLTSPPAADNEVEMLDVYAELFMAAQEIIQGGGGNTLTCTKSEPQVKAPGMGGVVLDKTLIELAQCGEDGVPMGPVIRTIKLAYCYEQWEYFDTMMELVMTVLKDKEIGQHFEAEKKALEILIAMDLATGRRQKRLTAPVQTAVIDEETSDQLSMPPATAGRGSMKAVNANDDLIQLSDVLMSVVKGPYSQGKFDMDLMTDATLFLWNKCKNVFLRYQTGSTENPRYLQKMENPTKWVYILEQIHQVIGWCGLSSVDPALTAEVIIRLALVLEASAALDESKTPARKMKSKEAISLTSIKGDSKSVMKEVSMSDTSVKQDGLQQEATRSSLLSMSILNRDPQSTLQEAREILELGLENVSFARQAVALADGKSIADVAWVKELNTDLFTSLTRKQFDEVTVDKGFKPDEPRDATAVLNAIRDLHLELIWMYHRVCLKLVALVEEKAKGGKKEKSTDCDSA